ncbi:hypothetical protein FRX31_008211, partial [Thalictrum thalictroides]
EQRNENGAESSEDDEEYIASEKDAKYEQDEYEEENADVASLTHLSEDESDELWNLRENNIQKKKAKGKKNTQQQADRHNEPTPPLTEEPSLPQTILRDLPDYDTEYDSCYYDSPVEDEENPVTLKYVKNAFRDYSVVTWRSLRFAKNNRQMVIVKCNKNFKVPMANASWMAGKYADKILRNPNWKLKDFIKEIREKYAFDVSIPKASRARKKAKGEVDDGLIKHYAHELVR